MAGISFISFMHVLARYHTLTSNVWPVIVCPLCYTHTFNPDEHRNIETWLVIKF